MTVSYLSPVGMLGGGFTQEYFESTIRHRPLDFVAVDSGSTDGGANNLGEDRFFFSRDAVKRDMRLLLKETRRKNIPLLVGSCGGSGGNWNLNWMWEIVQEIASEETLSFTTALIPAEPDREVLVRKYREGRIKPLDPAPPITEETLRDTHRIVAMMGAEPFQRAVEAGADLVLAGRASDAALMAAIPLMKGVDPGLAWHAAKIAECGGAAVTQMTKPEGMICTFEEDYFTLEPVSPEQQCTPMSIASHALYETSNPVSMPEPGGTMLLHDVKYEALNDRIVKVSGSRFEKADVYTVKLEGAGFQGYRAAVLGGITDPVVLRNFDDWFEEAKAGADYAMRRTLGDEKADQCATSFRVYGRNAVLGERETRTFANDHEVGVFMVTVAPTQELANSVMATISHTILHYAVPQWHGLVSNLAFPEAPHEIELGPSYSFVLNHVAELDDPMEFYPIEFKEI
ncbi:DUF1446 domain-containing protein [Glutamicibacter sp. MNS18]|uniref:DUF1446 domain-containing protein n=1 Tax=Glutamicibacter sp. MNS18 TaxID=2989817 RepID=UPI0022359073|nr:DUF1446 domain-containing protein [Glutamicibacter sp. MNS18]MCW4466940.1 DUF1446 domain-containing protein [Glutamicibacter sp. MNS18]